LFPFNKKDVAPTNACKEISQRLLKLQASTLLFLRKIEEIKFKLPDDTKGVYLRDGRTRGHAREVTVIGKNNGKEESESWLIFDRKVDLPEPKVKLPEPVDDCPNHISVEIGFRLEANNSQEDVVRVKDSPLVVYFPTEKDTHFGFLIQGPYKTTPARDNIPKDDRWNTTLVNETACLIKDVLPQLKDLGLLSVSLLESLPIRTDDFPPGSMFFKIVDSIRKTLANNELLPADDGSFVSAKYAKLA
jgi:hypothetical protein